MSKTKEEIREIADELKKEGKKIVTCNGSFDLVHIGHVRFLQEAKKQGDILIVGLNSDSSIKQYKSEDRPIINENFRAEMLEAFECVDYVVIMNEAEIGVPLIKLVKPDVHVNGEDYGEDCVEAEIIKGLGGKLVIIPLYKGFSTTKLIDKILSVYGK